MYRFVSAGKQHLHTYQDKPLFGTTTVLGMLAKGGLTWWASGMACQEFGRLYAESKLLKWTKDPAEKEKLTGLLKAHSAETLAKIKQMSDEEYFKFLNKAYKAFDVSKEGSQDKGTELHAHIEEYIKAKIAGIPFTPHESITKFVEWSDKNVERFLFSELHCFDLGMWLGGIADFGYVDKHGANVLGDIKSTGVYISQWYQTAAYDLMIMSCKGGFDSAGNRIFDMIGDFSYHGIFANNIGLDKPVFNYHMHVAKVAFYYIIKTYKGNLELERLIEMYD